MFSRMPSLIIIAAVARLFPQSAKRAALSLNSVVSDPMPSLVTGLPEKFRRYECSDCQVCPFNPRTETRPLPALILWYFFGTVLALLRLILLVICIAFAILFATLGHLFSFIPSLRKFIRFIGVSLPCRAMLFLFGFTSVSASNVNVPAQQKVKLPSRIFASVKAGSVVISNLVSVSEILYFEYALSPVYALPSASGKNVIQCSLYRIICHVIFDSIPKTAEMSLSELQDVASRQRQPVLLFAEGHPSNGKAMLPFADVAHEVSLCNCAVVSVEVQPTLSLSVKCIPQDCLAFLAHCSDATHRTHMIRDSMAKVGSLNLIKQFSSAQGEDKQLWLFASTKALRAQFKSEWIDHFEKKKKK